MQSLTHAKPFIKWAGGKGQLLTQLSSLLPETLLHNPFTYIEPFVGGGAMLFYMLQAFPHIARVVINDINPNLAQLYLQVKTRPEVLILQLRILEKQYLALTNEADRKSYYLEARTHFNTLSSDNSDKAALFLFLNKTCFNGLYRENSKGQFNVPFGRYTTPTICNEEGIYTVSQLLNLHNVCILHGDFTQVAHHIDVSQLNFCYLDPPYRPLNTTSNFNTYVKEPFNDDKQKELATFCRQLATQHNCLWMLSNSDCSAANPDDLFFETLYEGFDIQRVFAARSINAVGSKRGKLTELLIRNYTSSHNG